MNLIPLRYLHHNISRCIHMMTCLVLICVYAVSTRCIHDKIVYALVPSKGQGSALVEAFASVDKENIVIGDRITLKVSVRYKEDITIQFPVIDHIGSFTVKGTDSTEGPKIAGEYFTLEKSYILTSYEIGTQNIPPLRIKYTGPHGEGDVLTNQIIVNVSGVIEEGSVTDIRDIRPPVEVPVNFSRLIFWILTGLGIFVFSGILCWFILTMKKRSQKILREEHVCRAPHETAYELLERLLKEDLVSKGLIKEYYYRLTNILRHYIEDRFGLLAPERTTEEFLVEMSYTNKLGSIHKELIREFLERCDMVKYAKYGPSRLEIQYAYEAAKRLIDETREEHVNEKEVVAKNR